MGLSETPTRALIARAERVPGLYNLMILHDWQPDETLHDLTTGQVMDVLRQRGFNPDEIKAVPHV